jgi:hypothetical protein
LIPKVFRPFACGIYHQLDELPVNFGTPITARLLRSMWQSA